MLKCDHCGSDVKVLASVILNEKEFWGDKWRHKAEQWCKRCLLDQLEPAVP